MQIHNGKTTYDVIVCGCGVAGFVAAVQAGRCGLRTAVIERQGMPGGILTVGGNNDIAQFFAHHKQVIRGIGWEYVTRLAEAGYAVIPDKMADGPHWIYGVHVNIPAAAYLMDTMLIEAGVDLYYGQPVCSVETENRADITHVTSVIIASKEGLRRLSAKVFIDCTGDGDVAVFAGASCACGEDINDHDGFLQPGSIRCYLDKLSLTQAEQQQIDTLLQQYTADGRLEPTDLCGKNIQALLSCRGNNTGHISGFNGADSDSRTLSEVAGRRSVYRLLNALRDAFQTVGIPMDTFPPMETIASEVAVRESRRILCDGYMTMENYVSGYEYPDAVCTSFYPIDLHRNGHNGIHQIFLNDGQIPTIPLSALLVSRIDNMMVAGRCASGDRLANSAYRVKASCMAMGQAAAACAVVALQQGVSLREAPLSNIRALLRQNDAIVTSADITDE